jgi:predicted RNA-binding Zn ribbon-like protein
MDLAMAASRAGTMKLVGGDPCLDFVNTVGGRLAEGDSSTPTLVREDKLEGYDDLLAWIRHAALLDEGTLRELARMARRRPRDASRVLARVRTLREALHRVLSSLMEGRTPAPRDLAAVNAELAVARGRERLAAGPEGLRWEPGARPRRLDSVLEPIARSAAALLTSSDLSRLRRCGGEGCGWLFLDRSRNHSRQWCTMEDCGNVSKVRRFRERHRGRERA